MEANDPNRCQKVTPGGQCKNEAINGTEYCETHNNPGRVDPLKYYLLTNKVIGDSARRHAASDEIKSLRDEIAITRGVIETRLNSLQTEAELAAAMPSLYQYIMAIEKLVSSCHAMEYKLGNLLDKTAILTLAQKLINIIDNNLAADIPDRDEIVAKIAKEMVQVITTQENQPK
jgi:hypothetical protein